MALRGSVKNSLKFRAINGACRFRSSQAASFACETHNVIDEPESKKSYSQLDTSFTDTVAAYKSKSFSELLRSYLVFSLCSSSTLVENNMKLMKLGKAVLGKKLFEKLMRATFYGQFVAGKDQAEIKPVIDKNYMFGVKSILDYSAEEDISEEEAKAKEMASCTSSADSENNAVGKETEHARYQAHEEFGDRRYKATARTYFYENEAKCDKNMEIFLRCIEAVSGATHGTGFAAIKMTALGRPQLLLQLSETIMRARQYFSDVTKVDITGNIMAKHVSPKLFERRFKEADISVDNPEIQKWLKQMTYDKEGLINLFSWSGLIDANILLSELFKVPNLKTGKLEPIISALTEEEEEMFFNMMRRLNSIFEAAKSMDVRVMVDAEQTYFQPAISRLTMELMTKFNTEKAIVFNTYQCYLREAYDNFILDLEQAERQNFYFGAKLVRGAYMEQVFWSKHQVRESTSAESQWSCADAKFQNLISVKLLFYLIFIIFQERERAKVLGYADPINPSYEATSAMYEKCLSAGLQKIQEYKPVTDEKRVAVMVASHNEDTVKYTVEKMQEYGIEREDKVVCFGQLLGMCDHISFPLGQSGYSVYKYVPYGPVDEVLPYLSRRAQENRGVITKIKKEKNLLFSEIRRRVKSGQVLYDPLKAIN
ncbi:proline dehydrogenase 1, mitochondrial-like [Artemia franciscana]|uniref:proline dehydrogenase 1, mitochondrial-like n=1 Tax=Artemia franciscana TaxID=6661 RepID=UPI0032DA492B